MFIMISHVIFYIFVILTFLSHTPTRADTHTIFGTLYNIPIGMDIYSQQYLNINSEVIVYPDWPMGERKNELSLAQSNELIRLISQNDRNGINEDRRKNDKEIFRLLDLFVEVLDAIQKKYVKEPDNRRLILGAIRGMIEELDWPSEFETQTKILQDTELNHSFFRKIGISVNRGCNCLKVVFLYPESPAGRSGLRIGDYITHIQGIPVEKWSLEQFRRVFKADTGTMRVDLRIQRGETSLNLQVKVPDQIKTYPNVISRLFDTVGYIRLMQFSMRTSERLEAAISDLMIRTKRNLKGLILDLRNNPGGYYDEAVQISDLFLKSGIITLKKGRKKTDIETVSASSRDLIDGRRLIVLINGGTSSAAEIVAASLKENNRAILIGEKTHGSGILSTAIPIPPASIFTLATHELLTPSGKPIEGNGITPDITVSSRKFARQAAQKSAKTTGYCCCRSDASSRYARRLPKISPLPRYKDDIQLRTAIMVINDPQ